MRKILFAACAAVVCIMSSPGIAADLTVPPRKEAVVPKKAAADLVCLRWIEQTYSWYNYCDPIPYSPRHAHDWFIGIF